MFVRSFFIFFYNFQLKFINFYSKMKNSDILEFSRYQSQQRIPKKKLATFPPSTIAASSNFLIKNLANIRTNMDTNLLADDQRLLKELFSTIASTFGSALAGIVVYSAMLFGQTLHSLFMMLIVGLSVALMITKDTAISLPNKRRRIHYLFALAFLVGLQSGKLLEFFGVEDSAHLFSLYFMNMVLFYSYTAASVYADSVKFLHLYGFLGASAFLHLLRSFVLPYTTFLRSAILFLVLGLDLAFLLFDTPLIVERWRHGKTDPLGHITAMFTDAGQISYTFILLLYQLCKQLAKQFKNDGAARAFNYGEKKRVEAKKLP